ncbi:efflux RND transporter periplasmic adaptor subunit [Dyadobacter luteus]|jgi:cobalt-zinc-cadmium efflux system membrane fusion protein|uniref:Efflux RND transporter periplasmic adaptor subunit n=1 Tax=Dyadobacter luteus TaxID=2259619 RepID=A0A3D8Y4Z3_9BACT|nr:efflux RND transporter periplasmic adaptor subunit [Dyadobacter luteus]REA57546.1 efflux RND transporter periplasmic adaptor subunit [Dyadobacter luteus]
MKKLISVTLLTSIVIWNVACSKKQEAPEEAKAFMLSDTMMSRITLDTVKTETVRNELTLVGKVVPDENKVIKIFPLVGGNVEDVSVELGDNVVKGQKLATIRSGEVADFERQMIQAQSDLLIAQKNLSSTEDLYESKLVPERDAITARQMVDKAQAELNRVKEIFSIYGIGKSTNYTIKSPISGFIINKNVNRGMQLRSDNSESLFTVGQIADVWVLANVNESDIPRVQLGMAADVKTISFPDQIFKGKVDKIYNVLDPETKTMKIRIQLQNVGFKLKPEMHATVYLNFEESNQMQAIPSQAVIFDRSKNWVMVFHGRSKIETRAVEVYRSLANRTYISSGLKDGDVIISKNQLLVYDALND